MTCKETTEGVQCQLKAGHRGAHYYEDSTVEHASGTGISLSWGTAEQLEPVKELFAAMYSPRRPE